MLLIKGNINFEFINTVISTEGALSNVFSEHLFSCYLIVLIAFDYAVYLHVGMT